MTNNSEFSPKDCPVGITNEKSIENLGDRVDMAIERLTEKVSEMKEDITSLHKSMDEKFESMDKKFESVDKRFDSMEEKFTQKLEKISKNVPNVVDERLQSKKGNVAAKIIGWIFGGLGAAVVITVVTKYVCSLLGL